MYKVFSGRNEQNAAETEGSPFAAATDVAKTINGVNYFRIEEHTHTGGTATCSSPAICEDCGNEYGERNPAKHANLQMADEISATHLQEGNTLHYYCDGCGKYYCDEAGSRHEECTICRYKKDAVEIPATGMTETSSTTNDAQKNKTVPATGDNSNVMLWISLLLLASGGLTGVITYSRKH